MKKGIKKITIGLKKSHKKSLFRNLITDLIIHGKIRTTKAKAKLLRSSFDKFITPTLRSNRSLDSKKRYVASFLFSSKAEKILWEKYIPEFENQKIKSGFTTIKYIANRGGDNASMAIIEIIAKGESKVAKEVTKPEKSTTNAKEKK